MWDDPQAQHANAWLAWLYQYVAEDQAEVLIPAELPESADETNENVPDISVSNPIIGLPVPGEKGGGGNLPARYMPPGRLAEIYDFYSSASLEGFASLSTFTRCWRRCWKQAILFRNRGQHSRCTLCAKYSQQRALCMRPEEKEVVKLAQASHVRSVLKDRSQYARIQQLSAESCKPADVPERQSSEHSVLSISIDGMDQVMYY